MNTHPTPGVHPLQAGQSLDIAADRCARLVVTEGQVLLQEPARWLAGTVVLPAPRRITAPAMLALESPCSVRAVGAARIVVEEVPGVLATLRAALSPVRLGRRAASA